MRIWRTNTSPNPNIFVSKFTGTWCEATISHRKPENMNVHRNTLDYLNLWRGEFADNYKSCPRLYKALTENEVYFEGNDEVLTITFYVKNDIQQHWIEVVVFNDLVEKFLTLSGIKTLELRVVPEDDLPVA